MPITAKGSHILSWLVAILLNMMALAGFAQSDDCDRIPCAAFVFDGEMMLVERPICGYDLAIGIHAYESDARRSSAFDLQLEAFPWLDGKIAAIQMTDSLAVAFYPVFAKEDLAIGFQIFGKNGDAGSQLLIDSAEYDLKIARVFRLQNGGCLIAGTVQEHGATSALLGFWRLDKFGNCNRVLLEGTEILSPDKEPILRLTESPAQISIDLFARNSKQNHVSIQIPIQGGVQVKSAPAPYVSSAAHLLEVSPYAEDQWLVWSGFGANEGSSLQVEAFNSNWESKFRKSLSLSNVGNLVELHALPLQNNGWGIWYRDQEGIGIALLDSSFQVSWIKPAMVQNGNVLGAFPYENGFEILVFVTEHEKPKCLRIGMNGNSGEIMSR